MTTDYGIMSIKLCLEVGNDEYIIVCNFGGRRMKGFEVIVMAELHARAKRARERSPIA